MRSGRINRMTMAIGVAGLVFGAAFCAREDKSALAMKRSSELVAELKKHQIPGLPKVLTQAQADQIELARTGPGGWYCSDPPELAKAPRPNSFPAPSAPARSRPAMCFAPPRAASSNPARRWREPMPACSAANSSPTISSSH